MNYRKESDGSVVSQVDILKDYKGWSLPKPITPSFIETLGYKVITEGSFPSTTAPYEYVSSDGIEEISGKWYTKFKVETYTGDDKTAIDNDAAVAVRGQRNALLAETDWAALSDVTLSDAMKTYRQALRDVPTQGGFPHTVTWPTKPS
tara:strand:+ start:756 stop:1199 length:444 start_codon:yes stop_codon:yes gene_type:complete